MRAVLLRRGIMVDKCHSPKLVIGYKNPDADSICSAISYARCKTEVMAEQAAAFQAGNINPQTAFVLSRFGVEAPPLVTELYPRIEDIMIPRKDLVALSPEDTVGKATELLTN
jgi:manganese-dependent inorganic pyrophosphatase